MIVTTFDFKETLTVGGLLSLHRVPIATLGRFVSLPIKGLGAYTIFTWNSLRGMFLPLVDKVLLQRQMEFVGNRSFVIIVLAGAMVGGIFGFQLGEIFKIFGATSLIGAAASYSLSRELAPVVGAFLVTGRAGSSMAAEIATMRVNEQIDAMRVMAVNPYRYLVAPRVLASVLMMPILTVFFVIAGVAASFLVGVAHYDVDRAEFIEKIQWVVGGEDLFQGMQKAAVFGLVFSSVSCFMGFFAHGGARGVGRATTRAVVTSYVLILAVDYVMTYFQFRFAS